MAVFAPTDGTITLEPKAGTNLALTAAYDPTLHIDQYYLENTLTDNSQLTNGAGYLTSAAVAIKQNLVTLTTTGTGASTFNQSTGALNVPTPSVTLTGAGTVSVTGTYPNFTITGITPATNTAAGYATGTPYSLTTTMQKMIFGTTSPSITLPTAGTYLIQSNLTIDYTGLTNAVVNTCSFKLRRTNNTATDLPSATAAFKVPVVTLLTQTGGDADIQTVIFTTTTSGDVIEMWGNRALGITLGSIDVSSASIVATRLY